ncbi:MAG: hypothetical protein F6K09_10530 [Merismopedia sp. SIO2A8]|nr:hypothetical protein [Merismopedia sp. SIO2A8]
MNRCLGLFLKPETPAHSLITATAIATLGILIAPTILLSEAFKGNVWASQICETEEFQSELINTAPDIEDDNVIVIGHLPDHNYVVVVPGQEDPLLAQVRTYVPDAFRSSSRLGDYIHAGAFETRREARTLALQLRSCRIRARVVYFRGGHPI